MPNDLRGEKRPGDVIDAAIGAAKPVVKTPEAIEALMARVRQRRESLPFVTTWEELKADRDEGRRF